MTNQCESCTAPTDVYLCPRCADTLKAGLRALAHGPTVNGHTTAGLLDACADVALRRTRLSTGGGHRKRGDEQPGLYEPDTDKGRQTPQGRAAQLLEVAATVLTTTVRDLCETRGITARIPAITTPGWCALWLALHVHAIACDENAGQTYADIDSLVRSIERVVDRPTQIELLGFCATDLDGKTCDTALRAPADAVEVRCRTCRTVRRADLVRRMAQSAARRTLITWEQVLDTNRAQPDGWRVADRTLRDWKATGALRIREYLHPDGTHGYTRHSDDDRPLYKWDDIETLRVRGVPRGGRKRTRARQ